MKFLSAVLLFLSSSLFLSAPLEAANGRTVSLTWQDAPGSPTGRVYDVLRVAGTDAIPCPANPTWTIIKTGLTVKTYDDNPAAGVWCYAIVAIEGSERSIPSNTTNGKITTPSVILGTATVAVRVKEGETLIVVGGGND